MGAAANFNLKQSLVILEMAALYYITYGYMVRFLTDK